MAGIGVVLNPYSKTYKRNPTKLEQMAFIIGDKASCKPTDDLDDLHRVADEFKSRDIDILAISGGDGTIHCTLSAFLKVYGDKPLPKIALLRGGTVNIIASTMGLKGTTEKLLSQLLIKYHNNKPFETKKLRLTKINDNFGCIFGMGAGYNFMNEYYSHKTLKPFIAGKTICQAIVSTMMDGPMSQRLFKRFDAQVTVDGKSWPISNYCAIVTGSIRQIGLGFNVFNTMITQNERIHILGVSTTPKEIISQIRRLRSGLPAIHPGMIENSALDIEIRCAEPMPYTIDGDLLPGETFFKISPGPELTVLI